MQMRCRTLLISTALVAAYLSPAYAADARLEEVIVTAQKREQNLQDVPMAITALGRELLENAEINNVEDLSKLVPSMRFAPGDDPTNSSIRIRGVGTNVFSIAVEPNVSVVLDEVPLARTSLASFEFADLERVEVLRGPQGTLFGKNATAGLVHVITRDPAPEFEAFTRFNYEEPQDFPGKRAKVQFGASGPIGADLGLRLTGFYKTVEGHLEDVLQNDTLPAADSYGLRGKLRWDPNEDLSVRLSLEHQRSDGESTPLVFRSVNPTVASRTPEIEYGDDNRQTKTFGTNRADITNDAVSVIVDWSFGHHTLTSVSGWRGWEIIRELTIPDLDGERFDITRNGGERSIETITQELRLTSTDASALDYTVGALWFENRLPNDFERRIEDIPAGAALGTIDPDAPSLTELGVVPGESLSQFIKTVGTVDTRNLGIFAQGTWHITPRWHLTAGARYIDEKITGSVRRFQFTRQDGTGSNLTQNSVDIRNAVIEDTATTGTLSLQFDWRESTTLYGTVSTGYRGGAFDFASSELEEAFRNPVDAETALSFELGSKSRLFDNRLELNVALFQTVFKDFQAQIVEVATGDDISNVVPSSTFKLDNAGELETRGIEIDFKAQPLESLFVFGSVLFNKAEFNEFVTQCFTGQQPGENGGVDENGDGVCDTQDVSGGRLPNAPERSVSITGRYEHSFGNYGSSAYLQLGGRWVDDTSFSAQQHPLAVQEAYAVWDLRLGWRGLDNRLGVAAYVNNLFDKNYVVSFFPLSLENDRRDIVHFLPMEANRMFGATVSYDW